MINKKIFWGFTVSAMIMILLPWLAVTFVKGVDGMAVCFLLFFAVNPIYSVIVGTIAGENIRCLWSLPVISSLLFLAGTWIFFDMGETAFIMYAVIYLVLGAVSMLISAVIRKKCRNRISA